MKWLRDIHHITYMPGSLLYLASIIFTNCSTLQRWRSILRGLLLQETHRWLHVPTVCTCSVHFGRRYAPSYQERQGINLHARESWKIHGLVGHRKIKSELEDKQWFIADLQQLVRESNIEHACSKLCCCREQGC